MKLMRNWKTTTLGVLAILTTLIGNADQPAQIFSTASLAPLLAGIAALFAKDHDVTGGSRS